MGGKTGEESMRKASRKYYQANKDNPDSTTNQYKAKHKKEMDTWRKTYYDEHPDYFRNWRFKRKYGISLDDYNVMLEKQHGVCAICGKLPFGRYKRLCVDHNHDTGVVRGLLCVSCNHLLGDCYEDVNTLRLAILYLKEL